MVVELEEIKEIRKKLGLTQSDLAKRAGVSQSLIAKVESGRLDPAYSNAQKLINALNDYGRKKELCLQKRCRHFFSPGSKTKHRRWRPSMLVKFIHIVMTTLPRASPRSRCQKA